MQSLTAVVSVALLALAFAGCADDPERYPDGVPTTSTTSRSVTTTATTGSTTTSASTTSSGPVANQPPTGSLSVAVNGTNATFTLNGTDPDGDDLAWTLDLGDGNATSGTLLPATVNHTYNGTGNFTATFTVTDGTNPVSYEEVVAIGGGGEEPVELCPTDPNAVELPSGHYATPMDSAADPPFSIGTVWIYEESNGIPGLQRNDDTMPTSCPNPDTIIF